MRWYGFDADAGDRVSIELVEGDGMEYMIVQLLDPQGQDVGNANSYLSAVASFIDTQVQSSGTYSLRVRNSGVKTGPYTVSLTKLPPSTTLTLTSRLGADACETLVAGCYLQGTIESPGQAHRYSFDADAGDRVFIELVEGEGMEYMIVQLFDPQGQDVGNANSYLSAVVSFIDTQLQTGGTYTLRIGNSGVKTGSYTLSFNKAPP